MLSGCCHFNQIKYKSNVLLCLYINCILTIPAIHLCANHNPEAVLHHRQIRTLD
jgi:hypothetical protein